jgi:hypothetical protein
VLVEQHRPILAAFDEQPLGTECEHGACRAFDVVVGCKLAKLLVVDHERIDSGEHSTE